MVYSHSPNLSKSLISRLVFYKNVLLCKLFLDRPGLLAYFFNVESCFTILLNSRQERFTQDSSSHKVISNSHVQYQCLQLISLVCIWTEAGNQSPHTVNPHRHRETCFHTKMTQTALPVDWTQHFFAVRFQTYPLRHHTLEKSSDIHLKCVVTACV